MTHKDEDGVCSTCGYNCSTCEDQTQEWCENCSGIGEQFPMVICTVCRGTGVKERD